MTGRGRYSPRAAVGAAQAPPSGMTRANLRALVGGAPGAIRAITARQIPANSSVVP